jgi:hypothetical protein
MIIHSPRPRLIRYEVVADAARGSDCDTPVSVELRQAAHCSHERGVIVVDLLGGLHKLQDFLPHPVPPRPPLQTDAGYDQRVDAMEFTVNTMTDKGR